ncbi:MAG TPA: hypothetical protein VGJ60_33400 [Chloroflexota bacterium]
MASIDNVDRYRADVLRPVSIAIGRTCFGPRPSARHSYVSLFLVVV